MVDLFTIFSNIKPTGENEHFFSVEDITSNIPHKLGCSQDKHPMFFIECSDDTPTTNINLKQFQVNFNQECSLKGSVGVFDMRYAIVELKSTDSDLQKYFLELVYIVLCKLPQKPKVLEFKREISKVISLFTASPSFSREIVKGLWAELLVIARSSDPLYLIRSWHVIPEDKYDFNDGIDKIEVKATSSQERIHTFAIEQLNPNKDSQLLIASVIAIPSGQGASVFDLIDAISSIVTDTDALMKIKEIAYQTIGIHLSETKRLKFDIGMAIDSYKLYDYTDIPAISLDTVPANVTNVHFSSCLKGIPVANVSTSISKLHKAL